jgi:hypothetical protein
MAALDAAIQGLKRKQAVLFLKKKKQKKVFAA